MKNYLLFTILFLSSNAFSCGYSPYGEDVRYCLFHPTYFHFDDYKLFHYNANRFGFDDEAYTSNLNAAYQANELDWYLFVNKKVSLQEIRFFMQNAVFTDFHEGNSFAFLNYLYTHKKQKAIDYLKVAKQCEGLNAVYKDNDVWERNATDRTKNDVVLQTVKQKMQSETDVYFKRKYAFLAIRLAYYSGKPEVVREVFTRQFKNAQKDYLYFWSCFFYALSHDYPEKMNDVAALLVHAPEKRYASYYYFKDGFDLQKALKFAKTKEDIANLYAYASVQKVDQALPYLKEIQNNNPNSSLLSFLILREINKIEDWVYTPYYTNYLPSIEGLNSFWSDSEDKNTTQTLRLRSETDRLYAKELLAFVQQNSTKNKDNEVLWKASEIQLQFMVRNYQGCLQAINQFQKKFPSEKVMGQIEQIKALCITANQPFGKAVIKPEIENLIIKHKNDVRFMFALGRELEFRGNSIDGLALLSISGLHADYQQYGVEWKGNRLQNSHYLEEFYDYFDYLDFVYNANELQKIVDAIPLRNKNAFQRFLYQRLTSDYDYLKDLLGTKYIREDRLREALTTFQSLGSSYWQDNYNAWERGKYDEYYAFEENPFYQLKYTKQFIATKEPFLVNKLSVTQHLIKYIELAQNQQETEKDYYYFLVANCYFNMSDAGNSWMMRRYQSYTSFGANYVNESYIDEREYREKQKAKMYYELAYKHAKTDQFKALCLRMMDFAQGNYPNRFMLLKNKFPQYYDDLSNCENLNYYFKTRR